MIDLQNDISESYGSIGSAFGLSDRQGISQLAIGPIKEQEEEGEDAL